ncbi:MAG: QVPTGV class sortase B protein-sorting domain-containing protein, partial [Clostridia bacterium]|nr:QVPTGV class sortase B protein-sorting domain-containing protein [Clostridia bacterium]
DVIHTHVDVAEEGKVVCEKDNSGNYTCGYDVKTEEGTTTVTYTTSGVVSGVINSATENLGITNNKGAEVDTGISVDSIPYIAMLGVVAIGGTGFIVSKKRRSED